MRETAEQIAEALIARRSLRRAGTVAIAARKRAAASGRIAAGCCDRCLACRQHVANRGPCPGARAACGHWTDPVTGEWAYGWMDEGAHDEG